MRKTYGFLLFPFMEYAIQEARKAYAYGEVPVGAVVVSATGKLLAAAGNEVERQADASAHAEILALRRAAKSFGRARLFGCSLYVTLEPCAMCAAAISLFRVKTLIFGAYDPKGGGVEHGVRFFEKSSNAFSTEIIGGVRQTECRKLLQRFFQQLRE